MSTRSLTRRCRSSGEPEEGRELTMAQHSSGNQKAEEDAKKDTDVKVKEIDSIGNKSGSKVVDQLIAAVTNAKAEPPRK
jgi:V-type H+-transporting ATPase subunit G